MATNLSEISPTAAAGIFATGIAICWKVFSIFEERAKRMIRKSRNDHEVAFHGVKPNDEI